MKRCGLTLSIIFEAQSANYGETIGNISQLKKMTKGNGETYTYISRQAILYNIRQQMRCDNTPVSDEGVVQFAPATKISEYPELDLFGYMKTNKAKDEQNGGQKVRSAVVRVSNAISLEPYNSDLDFLTNMGLAKRGNLSNGIAQSEIHTSLYSYTIAADLDAVGIDANDKIEISSEEKAERIILLLDTIQFLYRDIRGRRENLNPIFAVGGIYERKNPYFESRIELYNGKLNVKLIQDVIGSCGDTKENTLTAVLNGKFANPDEIAALSPTGISELFEKLKEEVKAYYA